MNLSACFCGARVRPSLPMWGLLCAICASISNLSPVIAQTPVERDQQALAVLPQTIAAAGGLDLLGSIQDVTETGSVTYSWSDSVTATVTIKGRGLKQFRADAALPNG